MNAKNFVIMASLALNAGLVAALAFATNRRAQPSAPILSSLSKPQAGNRIAHVPFKVTNTITVDWQMVESEDYKNYIANLRAIGCPEETIRDIIIADVNKLFAARQSQAAGGAAQESFQFWKKGRTMFRGLDEEKLKQQKAIAEEKRTLIKELLGIDFVDNTATAEAFNPFSEMLGFLSKERQQQVAELEATYVAKQQKLFENRGSGPPTAEDRKKLLELQRQKEAEIAKALTPQEFEDYQLRMSPTAQAVRSTLGDFEATEQEFREIFKARKPFDEQYGAFSNSDDDPANFAQRVSARTQMEAELRQSLGEQRFQQWNYESQYASSSLRGVAEQHNIPRENIYRAFDVRKDAQQAAAELLLNQTLAEAQRQEALQGIRNEAETAWRSLLGPDGWNSYNRRGSRWLDQISPSPNVAAR